MSACKNCKKNGKPPPKKKRKRKNTPHMVEKTYKEKKDALPTGEKIPIKRKINSPHREKVP